MNERSSRAHAVFMVALTQRFHGRVKTSRLHLVDLGGSEQVVTMNSRLGATDARSALSEAAPSHRLPLPGAFPTDPTRHLGLFCFCFFF